MLKFVMVICSSVGASFGGEVPPELVTVYRAFQQNAAPREVTWMEYYKNIPPILQGPIIDCKDGGRIQFAPFYVPPSMQWAVPNQMLSGAPSGPGFPPASAFRDFPSYGYPVYGESVPPSSPRKR